MMGTGYIDLRVKTLTEEEGRREDLSNWIFLY
jgi:hypothetical protein